MLHVQRYGPDAPATPRLAASLRRLGHEVDQRWPSRRHTLDGWIGDRAHAARVSDHNPDARGLVHALDLDRNGVDPWSVLVAVTHHPATWYVIFRGRIWSRTHQWIAQPYDGPDSHNGHLHISILSTTAAERSSRRWLHQRSSS